MKKTKPNIPNKAWFQSWKLTIESGKPIWNFKPPAVLLKKYPALRAKTAKDLALWQNAFKQTRFNPNPEDGVCRQVNRTPLRSKQKIKLKPNPNTKFVKAGIPKILSPGNIQKQLTKGWDYFFSLQDSKEGIFPCDYGGPLFLLPGLALFTTITGYPLMALQKKLMVQYIFNHQNNDGGWGLHIEGESLMFTTVLNYVALRLWGESAHTPEVKQAHEWIIARGGATQISTWGKSFLAVLGLYEWEGNHSWFPEAWLLPRAVALSPHNYWCHARMVYLPLSYLYGIKFNALESTFLTENQKNTLREIRSEIYSEDYSHIQWSKHRSSSYAKDNYFPITRIFRAVFLAINGYETIHFGWLRKQALKKILSLIHTEDNNTHYINLGPINKIYNALVVFLEWRAEPGNAIKKQHFDKHCERMSNYLWLAEDGLKMKGYSGSEHWDIVFTLRALMDGGVGWQQHYKDQLKLMGGFISKNQLANGGWGFSTKEQYWAVSDCSAEGLYSLLLMQEEGMSIGTDMSNLKTALDFLLGLQNPDGGWSSYEKCRGPKWLEWFNSSMVFGNIMIDYSYVECTSSNLQALARFHIAYPDYKNIAIIKAIAQGGNFILNEQRADGSWYGSWGICFTYGTFFAVKGLVAVARHSEKLFVQETPVALEKLMQKISISLSKAGEFLLSKQDADGSWGEMPRSSSTKTYHHLPGQVVHTAWAVLALNGILRDSKYIKLKDEFLDKLKLAINHGVEFLLRMQLPNGDWPTQGIAGVFNHNCMISYTNFRNIFPLWAVTQVAGDQLANKKIKKS